MDSAGAGGTLPPNFMLTPQQQSLLFAALNSNKPQQRDDYSGTGFSLPPDSFENNPLSNSASANAKANANGFNESPFLDNYSYEDVGDSSFDFSLIDDQSKMIGDLPGSANSDSADGESNEKRGHPDDEEDESIDPKRRESTDKIPKKPGRKPLTSEPTSKRKAQNRAAQRAFRERKEKHLKDLETQVEELQKASQATTHENTKLRAQVDRMTNELKQYKQRLSLLSNSKAIPKEKVPFGASAVGNLNDISFQFNFPKFGTLPGPQMSKSQRSVSQPISPPQQQQQQQQAATSPQKQDFKSPSTWQQTSDPQFKEDLAKFSGIFTPSMTSSATNGSRASLDSGNFSAGGATSSPSASSHSNTNPSSSCGTSPEPFTQSPIGSKPIETMTTIGEENPSLATEPFSQFANIDFNSNSNFDWLAQQNSSGTFDPQLFGDYREPQDNILSNPSFDDFFNDSLDTDFFTPYNMAPMSNFGGASKSQEPAKPNLMDKIEAQKNDYDEGLQPKKDNMNCNQIWERLQECPKAQSGEFDLDGLCSELTKKAKCSGHGPVVGEGDFDSILQKYMGKDASSDCVASKLGIEINRDVKPNGVSMP